MNCSQQTTTQSIANRPAPVGSATRTRRGFTLVELLVVIAIIGILISMLAVAIGPVLTRVHDGAVSTELGQIELAVENFKNQYGFYPPSFTGFSKSTVISGTYDLNAPWDSDSAVAADEHLQLLPYLNKISPNHRENAGASPTPLRTWWVNIGRHLDDRSSLVFWLSGLCANKQFPLTGGLPPVSGQMQLPVAYGVPQSILVTGNGSRNSNADLAVDGAGNVIDVPRDSFFDFRNAQLADNALDLLTAPSDLPNEDARTSPMLPPGVKVYETPYGDGQPNRGNEYSYRNSQFYTNPGSYHVGSGANTRFVNPNTFQLFTYGRDGLAANIALDDVTRPLDTALNRDNITNFANGRLETFDWRANLGL